MSTVHATGALALDAKALDNLKLLARQEPERALKDAARQFEVLFMNMVLRSMRDATPGGGVFDGEETRFYTTMLDQQLAQSVASRGIGLADVMARQLARSVAPGNAAETPEQVMPQLDGTDAEVERIAPPVQAQGARPAADADAQKPLLPAGTRDFVNRVWTHAVEASRVTGIPARFILGQAALESGWGRREIRAADGGTSFNLFGIKAGRGWNGPTVERTTTEFVNGVARKTVERFRAYSSYAEAFRDYARLLTGSPRYAGVLERGRDAVAFGRELQQAGYATDPRYGDKLARIITGVTLRRSMTG